MKLLQIQNLELVSHVRDEPTFPKATVAVAMSSAKLSPFSPGATQHIGFVPKNLYKIVY